jgi:hypothetical protein
MTRAQRLFVATLGTLLAVALPASARAAGSQPFMPLGILGGQYRYWSFSDGNDLRNPLIYWAPPWFHVQLEYWDFARTNSNDHTRAELGLDLRDYRKSVYTLQWQHQLRQERWTVATEQILSKHVVGRASFSAITTGDTAIEASNGGSPAWVNEVGADYYWGSYNFASATVVRDPRQGGLWATPLRVRLASERNDWVQATFVPTQKRTAGWALDAKLRWVRVGLERNSRYDYTRLDNTIFTIGFETSLDRPR